MTNFSNNFGADSQLKLDQKEIDDNYIKYSIAVLEKRLTQQTITTLSTPDIVSKYLVLQLAQLEHELFGCLFLDIENRLIINLPMFRGSLAHGSVYPREVIKEALKYNASAVIFYHNHPSGSIEPSQADHTITKKLKAVCELVDVRVLDHIIVAGVETYSFAHHGTL
jgi:DNA repair protein RadC